MASKAVYYIIDLARFTILRGPFPTLIQAANCLAVCRLRVKECHVVKSVSIAGLEEKDH